MQSIYLLTSLTNFKSLIKKTDDTSDNIINQMIAAASNEIENYTKRKLRGRTYGANGLPADYYNGDDLPRLYTKQYPIVSVTSIHDDNVRAFSSTTLKASTDYVVWKDEGIVELYSNAAKGSTFQKSIGNIKLIYTAGYDEFQIIEDTNDRIDFDEDGATETTANLTAGIYTAGELATHVAAQLNDVGTATFTCTYNYITSKFTITSDGATLNLLWSSGTNLYRTAALLLGYRIDDDDESAVAYTSNDSILGIPSDLEQACLEITNRMYQQSAFGSGRFDKESEQMSGEAGGTLKYNSASMPPHVEKILKHYTRVILL